MIPNTQTDDAELEQNAFMIWKTSCSNDSEDSKLESHLKKETRIDMQQKVDKLTQNVYTLDNA